MRRSTGSEWPTLSVCGTNGFPAGPQPLAHIAAVNGCGSQHSLPADKVQRRRPKADSRVGKAESVSRHPIGYPSMLSAAQSLRGVTHRDVHAIVIPMHVEVLEEVHAAARVLCLPCDPAKSLNREACDPQPQHARAIDTS